MIYKREIESDFIKLKTILNEKFGGEEIYQEQISNLEEYHAKIFVIKELLNDIAGKLCPESLKAFEISIEDMLDFIWLIYLGRYKAAIACLRTSLDIFVRGCFREVQQQTENASFSTNVDLIFKTLKIRYEGNLKDRTEKRNHSKFIEENFNAPIKRDYWELSDSIHGKEIIPLSLTQYISEILDINKNFDVDTFEAVISLGSRVISKIFDLFLLVHIEKLDALASAYKLSIVIPMYSEVTKIYFSKYLIVHNFE